MVPGGPIPRDGSRSQRRARGPVLGALVLAALLLGTAGYLLLDLDQDGLPAYRELQIGTDPTQGDTDGDRLADGWEHGRGISPLSRDTDGDGLADARELILGTDPTHPDSDGDGLTDAQEVEEGTDPTDSDTDEDEVADGQELAYGADPLLWDTDADGVDDGMELQLGSDPRANDTDRDGLPDHIEAREPETACNQEGTLAIADADDDDDGRLDGEEPPEQRCNPDSDGDGVLDGHEAHPDCVARPDCDLDGLTDAQELALAYDRLDPDTFSTGLSDGVAKAFEDRGQPPSRDEDGDGIPDAWEAPGGLISWGPYQPRPGQRDLFLEYVHVVGPDSGRYRDLDLEASYRDVERFLEEDGGFEVQWIETTVELEEERRPPLIPSSRASYYEEVLGRSAHAGNPYVTSMILNPQHDQSGLLHAGIAPMRSMLGAVDYGAHTIVTFKVGNETVELSPLLESLIVADRQDLVNGSSFEDAGQFPDGRLFLEGEDYLFSWHPFWFQSNPLWISDEGAQVTFFNQGARLEGQELSLTIAHELGHTLGLCHTELSSCQANLSAEDRDDLGRSLMDNTKNGTELELLPSEWQQVHAYMACAPQRPISVLAEGGSPAEIIQAKYEVTLENLLSGSGRACLEREALEATFDPVEDPVRYAPEAGRLAQEDLEEPDTVYLQPASLGTPVGPGLGAGPTVAFGVATLAFLAGAGVVARRRPGR